jgi:hypothetical protein
VFKEIYNFRQASVVGVPTIIKVDSTLLSWLCWVTCSYVGRLDTKTTSSRSACLKYLGLTIPRYVYGSANLVGRPRYVTSRGRCAIVALPARSGHQASYVGNEGLPVGCEPDGPAKYFWVLGRYAPGGSARLFVAMQDIWVSPHLHTFKINDFIVDCFNHYKRFLHSMHLFQDFARYPWILGIVV